MFIDSIVCTLVSIGVSHLKKSNFIQILCQTHGFYILRLAELTPCAGVGF